MSKAMVVKRVSKSSKPRAKFTKRELRILTPRTIKDLKISLVFAEQDAAARSAGAPAQARKPR